jgi:hypothetical protein
MRNLDGLCAQKELMSLCWKRFVVISSTAPTDKMEKRAPLATDGGSEVPIVWAEKRAGQRAANRKRKDAKKVTCLHRRG